MKTLQGRQTLITSLNGIFFYDKQNAMYLFKGDISTADVVVKARRLLFSILSKASPTALLQSLARVNETANRVGGECLNKTPSKLDKGWTFLVSLVFCAENPFDVQVFS